MTMKVWLVGDSGTGPGDISPGPFCPITRLLCGHRAGGKPIPQYPSVNTVLLCVARG